MVLQLQAMRRCSLAGEGCAQLEEAVQRIEIRDDSRAHLSCRRDCSCAGKRRRVVSALSQDLSREEAAAGPSHLAAPALSRPAQP